MKSNKNVLSHFNDKNARALIKALLLGLFALNRNVKAQDVLVPLPQSPDQTPTAMQQVNEMDVFAANKTQTESQPFQWEGLTLRPHPFYQFLYGDGIQAGTNQLVNTTIQQISPGRSWRWAVIGPWITRPCGRSIQTTSSETPSGRRSS
jgi:hypothetical protein